MGGTWRGEGTERRGKDKTEEVMKGRRGGKEMGGSGGRRGASGEEEKE